MTERLSHLGFHTYNNWARVRDWIVDRMLAPSFADYGRHTHIELPVRISGPARIAIGSDVFIGAGSWLQSVGDENDVALHVGNNVRISGLCVLSAASNLRIGDHVLLARNVYIADHSHAYDEPGLPIHEQGITSIRPTRIGAGAWLGQNVVVLPGANIGAGSVIGANSVVRDRIPDRCLAVGTPAKAIRRLETHPDSPAPFCQE